MMRCRLPLAERMMRSSPVKPAGSTVVISRGAKMSPK